MGDNHVVAGAIPAIETICFAPALGWDATLRRSLEKVQFLPVVLRGPSSLRRFAPTDLPQRLSARHFFYVTVWDESGLQNRAAVFDSLVACFA